MSEPDAVPIYQPLSEARMYWRLAEQIGSPGEPSMLDEVGAGLRAQYAEMAQTAALLSIAETLDRIKSDGSGNGHRLSQIAAALSGIAKDINRMRQGRR